MSNRRFKISTTLNCWYSYGKTNLKNVGTFSINTKSGDFVKGKPVCNQSISGMALDHKSKKPLTDVTIMAYNSFSEVLGETKTNYEGKYAIEVPCNKVVNMIAAKPNYSSDEKTVETTKENEGEITNVNFELSNYDDLVVKKRGVEMVDVQPIYFDYDQATIRAEYQLYLKELIRMVKNSQKKTIK